MWKNNWYINKMLYSRKLVYPIVKAYKNHETWEANTVYATWRATDIRGDVTFEWDSNFSESPVGNIASRTCSFSVANENDKWKNLDLKYAIIEVYLADDPNATNPTAKYYTGLIRETDDKEDTLTIQSIDFGIRLNQEMTGLVLSEATDKWWLMGLPDFFRKCVTIVLGTNKNTVGSDTDTQITAVLNRMTDSSGRGLQLFTNTVKDGGRTVRECLSECLSVVCANAYVNESGILQFVPYSKNIYSDIEDYRMTLSPHNYPDSAITNQNNVYPNTVWGGNLTDTESDGMYLEEPFTFFDDLNKKGNTLSDTVTPYVLDRFISAPTVDKVESTVTEIRYTTFYVSDADLSNMSNLSNDLKVEYWGRDNQGNNGGIIEISTSILCEHCTLYEDEEGSSTPVLRQWNRQLINGISEELIYSHVQNFSGSHIQNLALSIFDPVIVVRRDGKSVKTILTHVSHNLTGATEVECRASTPQESREKTGTEIEETFWKTSYLRG